MPPGDGEIILASRSDPERFAQIFDRHFDAVYRYLCRRVGVELADDLAAQTFVEAFDARGRFDTERSDARPWLWGIATNLLRRHRRTETRQLRAYARTGIDPLGDWDPDAVIQRVDAALAGPRVAAALARLGAGDRDALLLYAWTDMGYREIADALGIPIGTVRSRLNRARRAVRKELGMDERPDDEPARAEYSR